jgi:hypothetical protein
VKRTLDADRDGKPEEIRCFDEKSVMIRQGAGPGLADGATDTWSTYERRQLTRRILTAMPTDAPTPGEHENARMTSRETIGIRTARSDALQQLRGGRADRGEARRRQRRRHRSRSTYQNKLRVRSVEDRDRDGNLIPDRVPEQLRRGAGRAVRRTPTERQG